MSIVARSRSECPECGQDIRPGDWIRNDDGWRHTLCPDETPAELRRDVCHRCFEVKAVNGSCACEED